MSEFSARGSTGQMDIDIKIAERHNSSIQIMHQICCTFRLPAIVLCIHCPGILYHSLFNMTRWGVYIYIFYPNGYFRRNWSRPTLDCGFLLAHFQLNFAHTKHYLKSQMHYTSHSVFAITNDIVCQLKQ